MAGYTLFSTGNRFLNPVSVSTRNQVSQLARQLWTNFTYNPPVEQSPWYSPLPGESPEQARARASFGRSYATGAAFSGGLGALGEQVGYAVGQSVLNRAFSVAQGGGPLARTALSVGRRIALGPREAVAGIMGNVGHLVGVGAAVAPDILRTASQTQNRMPTRPINPHAIMQPIIKKVIDKTRRTRTSGAGGRSRAV